jgi:hypothetical protein
VHQQGRLQGASDAGQHFKHLTADVVHLRRNEKFGKMYPKKTFSFWKIEFFSQKIEKTILNFLLGSPTN